MNLTTNTMTSCTHTTNDSPTANLSLLRVIRASFLPIRNLRGLISHHQAWWLMVLLAYFSGAQAKTLDLTDTQVSIQVTATSNKPLARVLWLPSEYGVLSAEKKLAQQLSQVGLESWQVDLFEALLLSPTSSALDQIPTEWIAELIAQAHADKLPLFIIAPNKAAQLAVRGLQVYQQQPKQHIGLILLNPNLYTETPAPGTEPRYWPQTRTLNIPSYILQAELSPWRWQIANLVNQLNHAGSPVFSHILPQMRDRFYFRPDALEIEKYTSQNLAQQLSDAMRLLTFYMNQPRQAAQLSQEIPAHTQAESAKQDALQPYHGQQNIPLNLQNLNGQTVSLNDYQGKVVLLNFWASWCPPCLHEMPSMTRLKTQLKTQPFDILAVNLAEQPQDFAAFLSANPVNFPVLLDPKGQAIKDWRIMAYPTTYLIDKKGQIRYALFGGTEWDQPQHLNLINQLLAE
ncbi:MAG: TlpA disulfide reductase family protein [Thiomicrospira sp.]|jgi:thiol-disulfide isomerase/thioredoxin|nr:TlpA disulfide reductase family protein [Thiomicrospira sp.]